VENLPETYDANLRKRSDINSARNSYATIAADLGMSEGALRVAVHRLRKRYRHLLTGEIARTLSSPDSVEEEMQSLFTALAG
jgi:RNA polymerase sigma-70 factor (ECF subfamily)